MFSTKLFALAGVAALGLLTAACHPQHHARQGGIYIGPGQAASAETRAERRERRQDRLAAFCDERPNHRRCRNLDDN